MGVAATGYLAYAQRGKLKSGTHTTFTAVKQNLAIAILSRLGQSSRRKLEEDFIDVKEVTTSLY